jgi:hypothetical protein
MIIKESAPSYHTRKAVLFSLSHVFDLPSDCLSVRHVWDAETNAVAITGATNAEPIQITAPSHPITDGQTVLVSQVEGNTAANGTWYASYIDADNITLQGSVGNGDFTTSKTSYLYDSSGTLLVDGAGAAITYDHGGYLIGWRQNLTKITRKAPGNSTLSDRYGWYPQNKKLVVDWLDFSNDIIIEYSYRPTAVTDIPEEYHDGIIAYGVVRLMRMPGGKDPSFSDKRKVLDEQASVLQEIKANIRSFMQPATEAEPIEDDISWDSYWEY